MVVFPNCKINLGLRIVRKRADGFHDLETVFLPVALKDALELIRTDSTKHKDENEISFSSSGIETGTGNNNLCIKAYQLLKKDFPERIKPVLMHLHKSIPVGAGLGGGSGDAAFTLKLVNRVFNLDLSEAQLLSYALQLGSDCPFFIINKPCLATGRGEKLEPVSVNLENYKLVLVNPGIHISTSEAFSKIQPSAPVKSLAQIISQPVDSWKNDMVNDFEKNIFSTHPEIAAIKQSLYDLGAEYASMSGSGSTVYGLFKKESKIINRFPSHYFFRVTDVLTQPML